MGIWYEVARSDRRLRNKEIALAASSTGHKFGAREAVSVVRVLGIKNGCVVSFQLREEASWGKSGVSSLKCGRVVLVGDGRECLGVQVF